jgi:2-polyprenyl-6-methoxyphenol hydroxylase-like FAD-dependent oxidoreductase
MRKVIIIGEGAAGLSLAIGLKKVGLTVKLFEKRKKNDNDGLALLLLPNGLEALKKMNLDRAIIKKAYPIYDFASQYSNGTQTQTKPMSNLFGIKRSEVLETLRDEVSMLDIFYGHEFSHFKFDKNGNASEAHFTNGHVEKGDVMIAADGVHSMIRKSLFPNSTLSKTNITEIVSIVKAPDLVKKLDHTFIKTIWKTGGHAVGVLPCSSEEIVWFFQFDNSRIDYTSGDDISNFLMDKLGACASPVKELLVETDFSKSYLWKTHDLHPLPAFHLNNIGLIGDAAHVFNTLTSQGLNTALEDGCCLSALFAREYQRTPVSKIFEMYYQLRKATVQHHFELGRKLKDQFLAPQILNQEMMVPMIVS